MIVEAVDRRLVSHREPLSVGIDRQLNRCVPELALDVGGRLALLQQQTCKRVGRQCGEKCSGTPANLSPLRVTFRTRLSSSGVPVPSQ
jgi:hypothetical protein